MNPQRPNVDLNPALQHSPQRTAPRILVVDDDALTLALLRHVLERQGLQVSAATDGRAAQDLLQADPGFDALVLDLLLPQIGGLALLAWLRQQPALATLPVLVLSALDGGEEAVQALAAGASDYMRKPFNPDELLARLRRGLSLPLSATVMAPMSVPTPEPGHA